MAKAAKRSRRSQREQPRSTNWLLIGGILAVGAVGLFALLFLTLRELDSPTPTEVVESQHLSDYCQENSSNCVAMGSEDAPVTIVEISDYGCSHCKDFNLETAGLIEDLYVTPGQVRWVILPYALGPQTAAAPAAALCAAEQDNFFEFHRRLFEHQGDPEFMTLATFQRVAEDLDLDVEAFGACVEEGTYNNTVQRNAQAVAAIGVNSTPTFFINDTMVRGNQPLTAFQQQINAIIGAS